MSYENSHNLNRNEIKPTEIIEDYLELIRCSQPYCNCGKCIIRKYSHHPPNYQYEKNMKSSYKNEFNWKQPEDKKQGLEGNKHIIQNLGLDKCFKEHLKSSLISVMKKDYSKNLKLKEDLVLNNLRNQKEKDTKNNDDVNLTIKIKNSNHSNSNSNYGTIGKSSSRNNGGDNAQQGLSYTKINKNDSSTSNRDYNTIDNARHNANRDKYNCNNITDNINKNINNSLNNKTNKNYLKENKNNINHNNSSSKNENFSSKEKNDLNNKTLNPPFIGRSSYELMYPDWKTTKVIKEKVSPLVLESVPFNGRSSYKDNFSQHEKRYYVDRAAPIIKLDNLESSGKLINETTTKQTYKPIDYNNFKELNKKEVNVSKRPSSIVPAPYSKDSFLSSYERAFMYNNLRHKSNLKYVNRSVIY